MENFVKYMNEKISLTEEEIKLIHQLFSKVKIPPKTVLVDNNKVEKNIYFLISGIVKGYKVNNGKIIVEHLVEKNNFFTSIDSFLSNEKSSETFESITNCELCKISKMNLELLKNHVPKWFQFIEQVTNESLKCKMERVSDFQTLTAKERYLKFINKSPNLVLNVSIDNVASFLGMEPQSLSRIRSQVTF